MPQKPMTKRTGTAVGRAFLILLSLTLAACQSGRPTDALMLSGPSSGALGSSLFDVAEERGRSVLVVDAGTGSILYEDAAEAPRYPASLAKMMTLYLLFETVREGKLTLDSGLAVSQNAASRPPAKIGVRAGTAITVREAAQALAIRSANDVATVVAENISGSEEAFVDTMNARARALGMNRTRFANASGLPEPGAVTTARDMARLASALRVRFPQYAALFRTTEFEYGGQSYKATNKLLGKVPGVDGMKTGYTRASGFHLVSTVEWGGRRLIVVVMGGATGRERDAEVTALIERYL